MMAESESIVELQAQVAHLQRHIEEQDAEMYKFAQRMDRMAELLQQQAVQLKALNERTSGSSAADNERPPHY
ncbi:MAG: SlyX family protein [Opitutales bacterium]|jgi:uncharacterized coiled-coil protein SlyX